VEQLHKIFKLCGSPSEEYWDKLEVPQTGMFKPGSQYKGCIAETFKDFPHSALVLLDSLLALEPEARGTAATTLQSDVSFHRFLIKLFLITVVLGSSFCEFKNFG